VISRGRRRVQIDLIIPRRYLPESDVTAKHPSRVPVVTPVKPNADTPGPKKCSMTGCLAAGRQCIICS
jgi:hypothetical protein